MKPEQYAGEGRTPEKPPGGSRLHPVDWVVRTGAVDDVLCELGDQLRRSRRRRLRALAGSAVALACAGLVWQQARGPAVVALQSSPTSAVVKYPERQSLPDGSVVELKSGAQVNVAFTPSVRRVFLTRGEAHFQVAKTGHPFVVTVGGVEVRAVGTAFSVTLGGAQVDVVVTEGSIAVDQVPVGNVTSPVPASPAPELPRATVALVVAGNRVTVPAVDTPVVPLSPVIVPVETQELAVRLAWRVPKLEFSRTPLVEAVALMNQHATEKKRTVTFADPALGRVQVSGVLGANNFETLVDLLEQEHGIKAEYRSPDEIVLRKGR